LADAVLSDRGKLRARGKARMRKRGGIMLKTGQGEDPTRPVCVVAEGTFFADYSDICSIIKLRKRFATGDKYFSFRHSK